MTIIVPSTFIALGIFLVLEGHGMCPRSISGFAKKKHPPIAKIEPRIKLNGIPLLDSINIDSADDVMTDKPAANPFCTLSVNFMTDATSSPPKAKMEI